MALVYGIYLKATGELVYVGHTVEHAVNRFKAHVVTGCRRYCDSYDTQVRLPVAKLKDYWMFMHAVGVIELEAREFAWVDTYEGGLAMERELIKTHRPILNSQAHPMTRTPQPWGWYKRYRRACRAMGQEPRAFGDFQPTAHY